MERWVTRIWLPLLLLALAVALYFEFGSIRTIEVDAVYSEPVVGAPKRSLPQHNVAPAVKGRLAVGERYASLDELVADQLAAGYLKVGYFGKFWPAAVTEIADAEDGIVFYRSDGTRHTYTGFEGYRMKMVRLLGDNGKETIIIFRSVDKYS